MSRKRIQLVLQVLRNVPEARTNYKRLLIEVWLRELNGRPLTVENVMKYASSPTGIDRDRRRKQVIEEFPRDKSKYEHYLSYKEEMSFDANGQGVLL